MAIKKPNELSLKRKLEVLNEINKGKPERLIASEFKISPSTVNSIKKMRRFS